MAQDLNAFSDAYTNLAKLGQLDAQRTAGNSLAGGDYTGAANALYKAGDLQNGMTVANAGAAQRQAEAAATQRFVQGVRNLVASGKAGDPNDLTTYQRAFAAGAQYAPQMGIDPAHLQQFKTLYDKDPQGALDFADAMAKKELQFFQTDRGILAGDKGTGNVSMAYKLPGKPDWKEVKNADGSSTFVDVNDPRNQMGATPPAMPATQQAAGAPRGVRNNNPLNVSTLPNGQKWDGQTGADGQYAVFATPEAGFAAADKNLQAYATRHGINTIAGVISRWAPPGSNDTASYIQTVAKDLGVAPDQPLNLADAGVRQRLLQSMSKVELGPGAAQTMQGGAGQDTLQGRRVAGSAPKASQTAAVDPNIVKGLIEGRIAPPTQKAAATPYWQAQLEAAAAQDPTFDMVNFQARSKARADFTSGKSAQNITALNTVIGHLDHLDRTIDGLNNTDNLGPLNRLNNQLAHGLATASGTDARIKNFETAKTAVANELTRVFRGTGGAEADIQGWMKQLDAASSPQALHSVVQSMAELINSRIQALGEQYSQGMGTTKDPITLLTPDKQKAFNRMMGNGGGSAPSQQAGGATPAAAAKVIRYDARGNRIP